MNVFSFQSYKDDCLFGFSKDRTGSNLPSDEGPWRALGSQSVVIGEGSTGTVDPVLDGVAADGYFVARSAGIVAA